MIEKEQGRSPEALHDLMSEVMLSFPQYPIGYSSQLYSVWEGTTPGCENHWGHLGYEPPQIQIFPKLPMNRKGNALKGIMHKPQQGLSPCFQGLFYQEGREKSLAYRLYLACFCISIGGAIWSNGMRRMLSSNLRSAGKHGN